MTKAEIVQAVYSQLGGFSKKESADLVDLVFETMKETLGRGEKIKISGFGNFVLRDKRRRQGRNPQTGDPIVITERRVLNFKASQILKHALNTLRAAALDGRAGGEGRSILSDVRSSLGDGRAGFSDGRVSLSDGRSGDSRSIDVKGEMKSIEARSSEVRSDEATAPRE
jgi:integration host factor subunit alpha